MKIIEINHYLGGGGASRFMTDLCNQYAKNAMNQVIAIATNESSTPGNDYISFKDDLDPKVKFYAINSKSGLSWRSIWGVFSVIKEEKPDVVHLHCNNMLLLFPLLFLPRTRYIHTIHTLVTRQYSGGIIKRVANWMYKTGRVQPVTISGECHISYKECFGRQEDIQINNGRDALRTTDKRNAVEEELNKYGVEDGIPVFIHVARHHPVKNHDRLFKTFDRLTKEGKEYQLIVIGDHYDDYVDKFRTHKNIHLIGPRTNIGDYMSFADYFVLASDKEGLPLALLEAMSMGVVPVCTPAGGIKDVIRDGENGYMGSIVSDEEFYLSVKKALSERGKIKKENIIQEYRNKYSVEDCAKKYMELYKYR